MEGNASAYHCPEPIVSMDLLSQKVAKLPELFIFFLSQQFTHFCRHFVRIARSIAVNNAHVIRCGKVIRKVYQIALAKLKRQLSSTERNRSDLGQYLEVGGRCRPLYLLH